MSYKLPKNLGHLGGHFGVTHVDNGALNWSIEKFKIKSFLDIGCGPGGMINLAKDANLMYFGIDGDPTLTLTENFILHDFTKGPCFHKEKYDLVWSCEFVEHVKEEYVDNFMQSFLLGKYIILTHAPPNTPGRHHVNCKESSYWIDKFSKYKLIYNRELTAELKDSSTMTRNFVRENGLFFINENF
jgi:SAM-dependent methyltransferase